MKKLLLILFGFMLTSCVLAQVNIKQVVFRYSDDVMVTVGDNDTVIVDFLAEMSGLDKITCDTLKAYCERQIDTTLKYVVYTASVNTLYIEPVEGQTVAIIVSEMQPADKAKVDAVGAMCTAQLNE